MFLVSFPIFTLAFSKKIPCSEITLKEKPGCYHTSLKNCAEKALTVKQWSLSPFPRHCHVNKRMQMKKRAKPLHYCQNKIYQHVAILRHLNKQERVGGERVAQFA